MDEKDIVTSPVEEPPLRVKNPKRVAAGLALAKKNKEALAIIAREQVNEKPPPEAPSETWSTNTLIGIGGLVIAAGGLYMQYQRTPPAAPQPSYTPEPATVPRKSGPPME